MATRLPAEDPLPQLERLQSSPVLRQLQPNPVAAAPRTAGERTVAQMHVPEGFRVELLAAEPELHQPIAFAWDERGRIWIAEAYSYPAKRPPGEGLDKIVIFEDRDANGSFESRMVFAEGLNLVSGLEIGFGGVWVGAAPELLFIPDRDHDGQPDGAPQLLLDGFGYQDTHETLNSFLWGPDGWLYGIQGVFNTARIGKPEVPPDQRPELRAGVWRYHPTRHEFEIFAHGGSNPWGLDYDEDGQMFMTHCRSYWGRGPTTHVIQGGQFWNQVNGNYADFIVARPPAAFPEFRNYLLASARYGHGAGGAGPRGSDAIYGGHSHVGTMIYLGDNWPDAYRGHLFTHNLGGHQINQQINQPLGSTYDTAHAGPDVLFCTDPAYVAVDLQSGPDGAVYMIDWVDPQHCHNPNTERWDRTNGRLYRMQWQEGYKPVRVDVGALTDLQLVGQLSQKDQWHARTAMRLLQERAAQGLAKDAVARLQALARRPGIDRESLRALWVLGRCDALDEATILASLQHEDPMHRAWAIQLSADDREISGPVADRLAELSRADASPVVRRYLASAMQRVPDETGWDIAEGLVLHSEDQEDRVLPYLIWHGVAPLMSRDADRGFQLAAAARMPVLADWTYWYAATLEGDALNRVVATLPRLEGQALHKRLAGVGLAMASRANVPMPPKWGDVAASLYQSDSADIRRLAEELAAAFGDATAFPRLRETLADAKADPGARRHAFAVLSRAQDAASLPVFLTLLDDDAFRTDTISLLARFDDAHIAPALIGRMSSLQARDRAAALGTLTSRASNAMALLDAVAAGKVDQGLLTAFYIRQMSGLRNPEVDRRVEQSWGKIHQSPAEKLAQISALEKAYREAPLWAYSGNAGRTHFETLCGQCHRLGDLGQRLGPDLTGAGKHGVRYYLENIFDPNAVIGTSFQMTTAELKDGDVISGLLVQETASAVTLRTTVGETVVARTDIDSLQTSENSLMPEGLLDTMKDREQIELLKFLMSN